MPNTEEGIEKISYSTFTQGFYLFSLMENSALPQVKNYCILVFGFIAVMGQLSEKGRDAPASTRSSDGLWYSSLIDLDLISYQFK
jgi:hypothetical protein